MGRVTNTTSGKSRQPEINIDIPTVHLHLAYLIKPGNALGINKTDINVNDTIINTYTINAVQEAVIEKLITRPGGKTGYINSLAGKVSRLDGATTFFITHGTPISGCVRQDMANAFFNLKQHGNETGRYVFN